MKQKNSNYKSSFLTVLILLISGFLLEYFFGTQGIRIPAFPVNLIILLFFIFYLIISYFLFRKTDVMQWFTGIPTTIAVITAYTFLTIIMGFVAQQPHGHFIDKIGLTHIKESYPFVLISLLLLAILGYVIINRMIQGFSLRNAAFFLNHFGLFIIIAAGSIGSGDLVRLSVPVIEDKISDIGYTRDDRMVKLPFAIKLNQFSITEYPPEIILYDRQKGSPIIRDGDKLPFAEKGKSGKLENLEFEIIEYYNYAAPLDTGFVESDRFGTVHAAKIRLSDGKITKIDWISTENFMHSARFFFFDENYVLGLLKPKVLKYKSDIDIIENNQTIVKNAIVEVNKPFSYNRKKIYQHSYDSRLGRWSEISIFEVVRDPWLPVVYIGIFMVLIGSCYLIYAGRQLNIK